MRFRLVATLLTQTLLRARFRLVIVVLFSAVLWATLYGLVTNAFEFLEQAIPSPDLHDQTIQLVFGMFFMTLMAMLILSTAVILYSSLFLGRDVPLLLTLPARAERVFLGKFQEAVVMSSWAFVLLGSPVLLAYGVVAGAPWHYFALLLPFLIAFVYVPAGLGAMACLAVVHRLPHRRFQALAGACLVVLAAAAWMLWSVVRGTEGNLLTPGWFEQMLSRLRIAENRLLPSWWLSAGLLQAAQHDTRQAADAVMLLVVMISNALFVHQLAVWTAARIYRAAYSGVHGRRGGRRKAAVAWIDRLLAQLTRFLPPQIRLLMIKDLRLFRRDPVQWLQFLVFSGLLALYFFNIRRFTYDVQYVGWVNVVSFLNVSVVGLLLSTFTTRFIFPMISLEGRRFWILGLLPVRRDEILWGKFLFAVGASIVPCSLLT
jgi:ABC-2 type transport system permease protein